MVDPITGAALIGAAGSIAGGLLGGSAAKKAAEESAAAQRAMFGEMMARLDKVQLPELEKQRIALDYAKNVFDYKPELLQSQELGTTAFEQISLDPTMRDAQFKALDEFSRRAEGGLTPEDMAQINLTRRGLQGELSAKDASILQNMEQRGIGGSGIELQSRLAGSQAAQQKAAEQAEQMAALQSQMKLQALNQMASQAGSLRGQEYGEQSQLASARDIIEQINMQNRSATQAANVDAINQAKLMGAQSTQAEEMARAAARQQEEVSNKGLYQQQFQNQLAKATGAMPMYQQQMAGQAQMGQAQAQGAQQMWSGIGQGLTGIGTTYMKYGSGNTTPLTKSQENKKAVGDMIDYNDDIF